MKNPANAEVLICEKLRKFGYERERHMRLYGEEFRLVSNPLLDGDGFAVEAIGRSSGQCQLRRMRIPLSLVEMLRRELASREHSHIAA